MTDVSAPTDLSSESSHQQSSINSPRPSIPYQRPTSAGKGRRYQHSDTTTHLQSDHWTRDIRQRQKRHHQHSKRLGAKRIARVIARSSIVVSAHKVSSGARGRTWHAARKTRPQQTTSQALLLLLRRLHRLLHTAHSAPRPTAGGRLFQATSHSIQNPLARRRALAPHRTAPPLRFDAGYLHNNRPAAAVVTAAQHELLL